MTAQQRRNFFLILLLGALETISPFAIDLYLPAFPQIAAALHTTPSSVSLSLSSYFIGLAIGQVIYGPLLDRFGRKKPLYIGLALFLVASVGCLFARDVESMIAYRLLQALGGCAAQVASTAMVRDFFPVKESAKIFSLLMLVLGVSPLFAPTVGGLIAVHLGWQWIFILLIIVVILILAAVVLFLPEGHQPDPTISLRPRDVCSTFWHVFKEPQFYTYALAGSFSFCGLLVYVTGSSIIFIDGFHVSVQTYSYIFAALAIGMLGGNQLNIFLNKKYSSDVLFKFALTVQLILVSLFLVGVMNQWYDMYATIAMLFVCLIFVGIALPNSSALAMAPFAKNAGSASALLGFLQIGTSALASTGIAIFKSQTMTPVIGIMFVTTVIGYLILLYGRRQFDEVQMSDAHETEIMAH